MKHVGILILEKKIAIKVPSQRRKEVKYEKEKRRKYLASHQVVQV